MKKVVLALVAILLSVTAFAKGPGGDPGATGSFSEWLHAHEASGDGMTYVHLDRQEYSDGYGWGQIYGRVYDTSFNCYLVYNEDLLAVSKDAESAVIHVDPESIEYCWYSYLPAPMTFECAASGFMESKGVSNYETFYYDGYEYKSHSKYAENAVDCVVYVDDDIVLDASSGIVWDGTARVEKHIQPNKEQEEQ